MTVEIITGGPGMGKTVYAVSQRLVAESKRQITLDPEACAKLGHAPGHTVTRRIVVAGIRGLVVEHERLPHLLTRDASSPSEVEKWNAVQLDERGKETDTPVHQRLPGDAPWEVPALMQNWWLWCQPGDLICIDEAQFVMPRGTLGRKPPTWLQMMEVHRHYGVDFLLITQHPQLIDTTVRALCTLHRHVRSVMGSRVCMVYVWDHAANPERYHLATKQQFIRRRAHFDLYKSTVAVVAPPTAGRSVFFVVPLLLLLVAGAVYAVAGRFRSGEAPKTDAATARPLAGLGTSFAAGRQAKVRGCYAWRDRCNCFDDQGQPVHLERDMCERSAAGFDGLIKWERSTSVRTEPVPRPGEAASSPVPKLLGG